MAKFVPERAPPAPESELHVRAALAGLDDRWTVFHSVSWQSKRGGRQGDGESDFILMNPTVGLIVVEVKGGDIVIEQSNWFSNGHRIKNPYDQVVKNKYALVAYLQALNEPSGHIPVVHAVAFPSITVTQQIGMYGQSAITWDRNDLTRIVNTVARTVAHWNIKAQITRDEQMRIIQLLAPTLTVRRTLSDHVAESDQGLIELTRKQIEVFSRIRNLRRAVIEGRAGTGKTVLAMERARVLHRDGFSALITCYNTLLAEYMRKALQGMTGLTVSTFHAFCLSEANRAGLAVPRDPSQQWWEKEAANLLISAADKTGLKLDAVIIDEAQDFDDSWIEALRMIAGGVQDAPFYVFLDPRQSLYERRWKAPTEWPVFELDVNCRNTEPIAKRVAAIHGDQLASRGVKGHEPVFIEADLKKNGSAVIHRFVARLIEEEGLQPAQICVLSDDRALIDRLRQMAVANAVFCAYAQTGVAAETIARFKGLEADAIVVAVSDPATGADVWTLAQAYVGMSRARGALFVCGSRQLRALLKWTS